MRFVKPKIAVRIAGTKNVCILTVFINLRATLRRAIFVIVISEQPDNIWRDRLGAADALLDGSQA